MTLIEKERLFNYWNSVDKGGLLRIVPEEGNPLRERGAPMQDPEEMWWLLKRLDENIDEFGPIDTIVEMGTCDGGGLKVWEQILLKQRLDIKPLLVAIDCGPNIQWDYTKSTIDIRIIVGDTFNPVVRQQVKEILNGRKVDFLFQDASHTSDGVKNDFLDYGGFVGENRMIGFHDTRLFRSFWDDFTGGSIDGVDDPKNPNYSERALKNERAIFHKEEYKISLGTGIFYNLPTQNVIKFREI